MSEKHIGKVIQITGPVLDIRFEEGELPDLKNAIEIEADGRKVVAEVAQQVGDDVVRCIAISSTDGLVRGTDAVDTGGPITVSPWITSPLRKQKSAGLSTALLPHSRNRCPLPRYSRQVSRS